MRILICESTVGSGLAAPSGPAHRSAKLSPLLVEGRAMLAALLADFAALGEHTLVTILGAGVALSDRADDRLASVQVVRVPTDQTLAAIFRALLVDVDAALVVAPETGGVLAHLSEAVEQSGRLLLGSASAAARLAGDKLACARRWQAHGVPTPPTIGVSDVDGAIAAARRLGFPLVVKPADGAGAVGTYRVSTPDDVRRRLPLACAASGTGVAVLQPWIDGVAASVSLLVGADRVLPLSLNAQLVTVTTDGQIAYHGGTVPLVHPDRDRAFAIATAAVRAIPGLRGYVGVDLVLSADGPVCVELNPRLTTAYVGLRRAVREPLAARILHCAVEGDPGEPIDLVHSIRFDKTGAILEERRCPS